MSVVVIGIDPGLVDTGVVVMEFSGDELLVHSQVFKHGGLGLLPAYLKRWPKAHIFVEAYRERGTGYSTNNKMRDLMQLFKQLIPKAKVIDNTGVKFVVKQALMERFGVWKFDTPTHHQDLRSAARIGIYGALKDDALNQVFFDYVCAGGAA